MESSFTKLTRSLRHIISYVDENANFEVARVNNYCIWKPTVLCNFDVACGNFYFVIVCQIICNYLSVA